MTANYGDTIILPKPEREGYTFRYWKGSRYRAGAKYAVSGDHGFRAMWKKNGVKTGDDTPLALWIAVSAAAALALAFFALKRAAQKRK